MGVSGDPVPKKTSSEYSLVLFSEQGSDVLLWIFGIDRSNDSSEAKIWKSKQNISLKQRPLKNPVCV